MGILTRREGDLFIITSDRRAGDAPKNRAPRRLSEDFDVWTGQRWSSTKTDAITFASQDAADEYVRANFRQITS